MMPREWLIEKRLQHNMTREQVAQKIGVSPLLYSWLENDDTIITNPSFIGRLKKLFGLTAAQHNTMVAPRHYI